MQSGKLIGSSLSQDFDRAIPVVAYPTGDSENMRLALYTPAKPYALHSSADQKMARLSRFLFGGHKLSLWAEDRFRECEVDSWLKACYDLELLAILMNSNGSLHLSLHRSF